MPTALFYRVFRKTLPAVRGPTCPPSNESHPCETGTDLPSSAWQKLRHRAGREAAWGFTSALREVRADRIVLGSKMDVKVTYQKHGPGSSGQHIAPAVVTARRVEMDTTGTPVKLTAIAMALMMFTRWSPGSWWRTGRDHAGPQTVSNRPPKPPVAPATTPRPASAVPPQAASRNVTSTWHTAQSAEKTIGVVKDTAIGGG